MTYCTNCGTQVGTSQYCPNCGQPQGKTHSYSKNMPQYVSKNPNGQYQQINQQNSINSPKFSGSTLMPKGVKLLVIYEILFGVIMIIIGLYLSNKSTLFAPTDTQVNSVTDFVGVLLLAVASGIAFAVIVYGSIFLGVIGIIAGILMLGKRRLGNLFSKLFLYLTGICAFFLLFIPTIFMIWFISYLNHNEEFIAYKGGFRNLLR